jgi:hypothetical protein
MPILNRDTLLSAIKLGAILLVFVAACSTQRLGRKPTARRRRPLDWLDTQDGHHDVRPPGPRAIPLALNLWQSHGSTNRKPAPERFPRAHAA